MTVCNAMLYLSIVFVLIGSAISTCCEEISSNVKKKEITHATFCSNVTSEFTRCCKKLEIEVKKQREAYKTLCSGMCVNVYGSNLLA